MYNNVPFEQNSAIPKEEKQDLPTATEMARLLKEQIRKYGGAKAVWKQIDKRFKEEENISIEGKKTTANRKLTWSAFEKAYKRLGRKEDAPGINKVSFGIRGNPVLLMNIFEILGISSFRDLSNYKYRKPDVSDEIFNIHTSIEEINNKIETIVEKIEGKSHKSKRVLKINCDFHEALERLYLILTKNDDISLEDQYKTKLFFFNGMQKIMSQYSVITPFNIDNFLLEKEYLSDYNNSLKIISMINNNYQDEQKRIALLLFLFLDYKPYVYRKNILIKYLEKVEKIDLANDDLSNNYINLLSPLFSIYLFLQIFILFIIKTGYKTIQFDDNTKKYIMNYDTSEEYQQYFRSIIRNISNSILKLLNIFIHYNIKNIPDKNYLEYKEIATKIISVIYDIFIIRKIPNEKIIYEKKKTKNDKLTTTDFLKYHQASISGTYNILKSNIVELNNILNMVSDISNATMRDLYD
jgi:hypothetical protein